MGRRPWLALGITAIALPVAGLIAPASGLTSHGGPVPFVPRAHVGRHAHHAPVVAESSPSRQRPASPPKLITMPGQRPVVPVVPRHEKPVPGQHRGQHPNQHGKKDKKKPPKKSPKPKPTQGHPKSSGGDKKIGHHPK